MSRQAFKYLQKKPFSDEMGCIFHLFQRAFIEVNKKLSVYKNEPSYKTVQISHFRGHHWLE